MVLKPGLTVLRHGKPVARPGPAPDAGGRVRAPASRLTPRDTPQIGKTLPLCIDRLPADVAFVGFAFDTTPVPVPLAPIGMPGCDAQLVPATLAAAVGANGRAVLPISIPNSIALFGTSFVNQAVVLDPAAGNAIGATVSDAARAVIGG